MTIPERLVAIREKNGYTRKRLAEELNRPYRTITNYESGEREPGHEYIIAIARKFGVSTDYLLGLTDDPNPGIKKSPSTDESAPGDEQDQEIMRLVAKMTTEQKVLLLALLRTTLGQGQGTPASGQASDT